ncbi:DNRLRE domain-containing protein [Paenibacillus sp. GCM10023252]|uniref:CBM96 family carbohydrate-binding protein n=1 Tax=Paenibacillus sp. GCM10023252 TaxID=3252649 RepID=UPI003613C30D
MRNVWVRLASACLFVLGLTVVIFTGQAYAQDYYINSNGGNNSSNGTSTASAWADFTNVNDKQFLPGDRILLARGGSWTGMLQPKGSGSSNAPIIIDAYGSGAAPKINGNGNISTVYLKNQQYWEIKNLEILNNVRATNGKRRGIFVVNQNAGTLNHIHILNNNVHDVYGDNTKNEDGSAGIMIAVLDNAVPSNYNDVLIDNNTVGPAVDRSGIVTVSRQWCRPDSNCTRTPDWYPSTNVKISNNYVHDVGGDGIVPQVTDGAIVEYNTVNGFNRRSGTYNAGIWAWSADNTIIQYNEASGGKTTLDGQGFDFDYGQTGTIIQYNYSHDNEGGFLLTCNCNYPSVSKNLIARYNISQNDKARLFEFSGGPTNMQVYNNTIYLDASSTTKPFAGTAYGGTATFKNNIFYLLGAGAWEGLGTFQSITFDYNTIYGVHTSGEPNDSHKLTSDPMLVAPGTGIARNQVDGYKLKSGSPSYGSGVLISNNGGKDYWGNPVSSSNSPNRGAYNGQDSEAVPANSYVAADDATVRDGVHAGINQSGTTADSIDVKLDVPDWNREGYFKFDFGAFTGTVASASIRLNPTVADGSGIQHTIALVSNNSWTEGAITWSTKPSSSTVLGTYTITPGSPVVINVTSQVQAAMTSGKKLSIRVYTASAAGNTTRVGYASSEHSSTGLRPTLSIVP